jgi:hypothetical protein
MTLCQGQYYNALYGSNKFRQLISILVYANHTNTWSNIWGKARALWDSTLSLPRTY